MLRISQLKNALKPRDRKSTRSELPIELWIEIIKIVIYSTLPISETCTSDDFPKALCRWKSMPLTYQRYHKLKNPSAHVPTTKNLRLVSRTWFDIVQNICKHRPSLLPTRHPARFIAANGRLIHSPPIFDKVANLGGNTSLVKPYPLQEDLLSFGRDVFTLLVSRLDLWRISVHSDKDALSFLVKNSQYFPNLHSLSLEDYRIHVDVFIDVEKGFPQLTSFQLSRCFMEGDAFLAPKFSLPNLEIAAIDIHGHLPKCSFPSLRHLSLHWSGRHSPPYPWFLDDIYSQLVSFINMTFSSGPVPGLVPHLQNVALFGARTDVMRFVIPYVMKEFGRTLKHVWILDWTGETVGTIEMILKSSKGLTRLTIDTSHTPPSSLRYVQIRCKRKGIQLVEMAEV